MNEIISANQKKQLENMLGLLAHIRLRPGMWIGSTTVPALLAFTSGFSIASSLLGINIEKDREQIWAERGWETGRPTTPVREMEERGWSEQQIIQEIILMMMLNIQRQYHLTGEKVLEAHNQIRQNIIENGREVSADLTQQMESLEKALGIKREKE